MKRITRSIVATLLSLSFITMPIPPAKACAPELAFAILINGNHPDLPLKLFAGGNLGVVQPGWAKSYLVVAYRQLSGKPLSKPEQDSIVKLWHERIKGESRYDSEVFVDRKDAYVKLRAKALGVNPKDSAEIYWKLDSYSYQTGIGESSFVFAGETLGNLLKLYPPKSPEIREWVKAQDDIFRHQWSEKRCSHGIAEKRCSCPSRRAQLSNSICQFLSQKFEQATSMFQALADKPNTSFQKIASYMVLRSKANQILIGNGTGDAQAVSAELQKAADSATKASDREDILDLLRPISYLNLSASEVVKTLATTIIDGTSKRFGRDVGDFTFILDGNPPLSGLNVQGSTDEVQR